MRKSTPDDFWKKVDRNGPVPEHCPELGPCWIWTGGKKRKGYGAVSYHGKTDRSHRLAWRLTNGPIPPETPCVLHRCDNPPCCNPSHLFLGDNAANTRDMVAKGRHRVLTGDAHYSRIHPEKMARGDRNGQRTRPECSARGSRHGKAVNTEEGIREIRRRSAAGQTGRQIARDLGLTATNVSQILCGHIWRHVH